VLIVNGFTEAKEVEEKRRQDRQSAALAALPPEPPSTTAEPTANIRWVMHHREGKIESS
jgi:hypothetical protein